jgi:hypothetical protein
MTETEALIAEIRQLRADVARLHAAHTPVHIRHGRMNLLFKDLSTNPYTQYAADSPAPPPARSAARCARPP